ncbi:putative uncharacterized protein [Waddlia chondrophila 2032/99]|nr:putative uncharacterized protein [Waddlia chondrophila 2032/99]
MIDRASRENVETPTLPRSSSLEQHEIRPNPTAETPPKARSALENLGQFFKALRWPTLLVKIAEIFEKIFAHQRYVKRHRKRAQSYMLPTEEKIKSVREFKINRGGQYACVPDSAILERNQEDYRHLDKKIGGHLALDKGSALEVEEFISGKHHVTAYDVRTGVPEPGSVIPTTTRFADKPEAGNHLINCYMTQRDGVGIIRTGVIDTPEKAAEFKAAAEELNQQMGRKGKPLRIVSQQLNSPEKEGKMIRSQHQYLLRQGSEDFQIAHLNSPSNRFYHYAKAHGSKPIVSAILTGEKKSHQQNVEGMAQYLGWILEDVDSQIADKFKQKGAEALLKKQKEMNQKYKEIVELEKKLSTENNQGKRKHLKKEMHKKKKEVNALRQKMIFGDPPPMGGMREIHKWMKDVLEPEFLSTYPNLKTRETLVIFRKLLGSQLEIEGAALERNQEHLMFFALNKQLGVISAMNCKSGLDRTGFLFALFLGAQDLPEDKKMKIALNWESYTLELNQLYRNNGYDPAKVMAVLDEPHRDHADELKHVFQMQQNVLQHLLTVSLPITGISTGMIGLKYGKGMKENLLPLYCIPPVVKNESGEIIQLLRYKRSGRPKGLTTEGHRLITQLSLHRGA